MMLNIPLLAVLDRKLAVNPKTNSTYIAARGGDNSLRANEILDLLNKTIIASLTYISVVACTAMLAYKLQAASRFRRSLTSAGGSTEVRTVGQIPKPSKFHDPSCCSEPTEGTEKSS
ncbi:hypothetical protein ElyMa_002624800, partial [Elysia marginata]